MASGHAYHCICSTLILATKYDLEVLPTRRAPGQDQAIILPLATEGGQQPPTSTLHNLVPDIAPVIVRREDGFDKRTVLRCSRCKLVIGYRLAQDQSAPSERPADDTFYILPGGLNLTENMQRGIAPQTPQWAQLGAT